MTCPGESCRMEDGGRDVGTGATWREELLSSICRRCKSVQIVMIKRLELYFSNAELGLLEIPPESGSQSRVIAGLSSPPSHNGPRPSTTSFVRKEDPRAKQSRGIVD
jgi:hypothetical protein